MSNYPPVTFAELDAWEQSHGEWLNRYDARRLMATVRAQRAENDQLRDALAGVMKLIDEGALVRSIENDNTGGWAMRQIPLVMALNKAQDALNPQEADGSAVTPRGEGEVRDQATEGGFPSRPAGEKTGGTGVAGPLPGGGWDDNILIDGGAVVGTVRQGADGQWGAHGCMREWEDTKLGVHQTQCAAKKRVEAWVKDGGGLYD